MVKPKKEYDNLETYNIPRYHADYTMKLDANENPLGCSNNVKRALAEVDNFKIARYPAFGELEDMIANYHSIPVNNLVITNGGDAALKAIFNAYILPDDEILYASPTYVMYRLNTNRVNGKTVTVPYQEKWTYPLKQILEKINPKTKIIVICSPNNPMGDLVSEQDIRTVIESAPDALVILDEAYYKFTSREPQSLKHLAFEYDNLAVIHTFSKDYGLAGTRLGYVIANNSIIEAIRKAMDPFNVTSISIEAGIAAMKDQAFVQNYLNIVKQSKSYMFEALQNMGYEVYPSEGNFICFYVGSKMEWYHNKLLANRIKVRRYPKYPELDGYIRLTLGTIDQMNQVLNCLKDYDTIVFDIDGVLVDESQSYRKAIQMTYNHFTGQSVSLEEIQEYKNKGGYNNDWKLTKRLLDDNNTSIDYNTVIDKFQEYYFNNGKGLINEEKLLVTIDLLKELAKKYTLAVFTGRPKAEAEYILKKEGIYDLFKAIITMDDTNPDKGKPDPYGLNSISESLNTTNIVYFGDMPDDIISACNAKVDSVGILPPQDKSPELTDKLKSLGAIDVYDNIDLAIYRIFEIGNPQRKKYEKIQA